LFVQENQVVALVLEQGQGVVAVHDGIDLIPLTVQQKQVGAQKVYLVINPENLLLLHGDLITARAA
jgi:hypothetical protein